MNIIRTEGGEELVILSRAEYNALLARPAANPEEDAAEEAWAIRVHDEAQARLADGEDVTLPEAVWEAIEAGMSPARAIREFRGLSQGVVAERAGMPRSYLSAIEGGKKPGSARALARIAAVLAVPMTVLIGGGVDLGFEPIGME